MNYRNKPSHSIECLFLQKAKKKKKKKKGKKTDAT
jgi:hypothetical protein